MDEFDLPNGWIKSKLSNVTEPRGEKALPSEYPGLPFLGMDHVEAQTTRVLGSVSAGSMKSSAARFYAGDVLYGRLRPYLNKVAQPAFDGLASAEFIVFPDTEITTAKFLKFRLNAADFVSFASHLNEGDRPRVNFEQIGEFEILVPPTNEQHRIVAKIEALFSELDKGIESFKTAREQLKIYRQALLKHAFSGKLTEQWRAENAEKLESADALLQRIQTERQQRYQQRLKDWEAQSKSPPAPLLQRGEQAANQHAGADPTTVPPFEKGGLGGISKPKAPKTLPPLTAEELAELPELPEGWSYTRLGSLIDEPTYGTAKKCDYEVDGIGVLRIPNVVSGKINASDLKFAQFDMDEIASYKLETGDILLIRSNGSISIVGKCALVSEQDTNYLYAGYLIKLRPNQNLIAPKYLINQLSAHSLRKQIEAKAKSTSGVNNINSGELQSLIVAVCSIDEQKEVLTKLETNLSINDQLDQTITTALLQAEALRQSILKKAFSGRLVPQDPNDEPAGVLLERIRAEKAQADKQPARRRGVKKAKPR